MSAHDDFEADFTYVYGALCTAEPEETSTRWIATTSEFAQVKFQSHTYDLNVRIDNPSKFASLVKKAESLSSFMLANLNTDCPRPQVYCCQGLSGLTVKAAFNYIWANSHDHQYRCLLESTACLIFMNSPRMRAEKDKMFPVLEVTLALDQLSSRKRRAFKKFDVTELTKMASNFERQCNDIRVLSCYKNLGRSASSRGTRLVQRFTRRKKVSPMSCFVMGITTEEHFEVASISRVEQTSFTESAAQKIGEFVGSITSSKQHELGIAYNKPEFSLPARSSKLYTESNAGSTDPKRTTETQPTLQSMDNHLFPTAEDDPLPNDSIPEPDYNIPCHTLNGSVSHKVELVGRTHVLDDIDKIFLPNDPPKSPVELEEDVWLKTFCLHGAGGIGKSQVAFAYAQSRKAHFDIIIWLNARTPKKLIEGYVKFAKALGIVEENATHNDGTVDETIVMNQVQSWLEKPVRNRSKPDGPFVRWLMILDEVDTPEELALQHDWFWPNLGCGCVLVTGRQPTIQTIAYFGKNGQELDLLPTEDAASMLLQLTQKDREYNALFYASKIAQDWGCFPLTMVCVASVIGREDWTLAHFSSLKTSKRQDILLSKWSLLGKNYSLAEEWALSLLSPEESTLLDLISLLDPSDIQERVFTRFPEQALALRSFPGNQGAESFESARSALSGAALLRRRTDYHYPSISVHGTIHNTLFARLLKSDRLRDTFCAAAGLVGSLFPATVITDVNYSNLSSEERRECDTLIPHVDNLVKVYEQMDSQLQADCATHPWARLLAEAAWLSYERSDMTTSLNLMRIGSQVVKLGLGDMEDLSVALWDAGTAVANSVGDTDTALAYIEERIRVLEKTFQATGKPTGRLCSAYSEKATTLLAKNELSDVMGLLDRSIMLRRKLPDFEKEMLFNALRGKGMYHMVVGEASRAETFFQEMLKDREDKYKVDDTHNSRTGAALFDLGNACYAQGQWVRGFVFFQRAAKNFLATSGPRHLSVARNAYKLSLYHIHEGEALSAITLLNSSLPIYERRSLHVAEKARVHFALSKAYKQLGNTETAAQHLVIAVRLRSSLEKAETKNHESLVERDFDSLCPLFSR